MQPITEHLTFTGLILIVAIGLLNELLQRQNRDLPIRHGLYTLLERIFTIDAQPLSDLGINRPDRSIGQVIVN